ncbi:helix-turn-helix domain-containing protein [Angelakisella massiliensis]|uniref:helix-turn-helix domain-containing protein n=1 Tax=Angelakisella massiliensis TaxID=1871018 RepID=UPI000977C60A|nr:S24 family peptidase [Angelakisella massiliensis]
MTLGQLIRDYRKQHHQTMEDFAQASGLSKAYISILERNRNPSTGQPAIPSAKTIQRVAKAMGQPVAVLLSQLDQEQKGELLSQLLPPMVEPYFPKGRMPVLGRVAAGLPIFAQENIEGYVADDFDDGEEYFALRVHGDSMNAAGIADGDLLVVRKQPMVDNGEIAVVLVNGNDATVKRFHQAGEMVTLSPQSLNPVHQIQIYNTKETAVSILGKVVEVRKRF